jgi:thiosulfate dehydrogenase
MFKAFVIGVVIGVLGLAAGVWFYFSSGRAPVATSDPMIPFEKKLAKNALHARLDKEKHEEAPVPADEATYLAGAQIYKQNCAICHGLPDQEQSSIAAGMFPKPPHLFRGTGVTDDPAWETHWKAENGLRLSGMPGFKGALNQTQLWQVSVLLANADKISPAVKAALLATPPAAPAPSPAAPPAPAAKNPAAAKK